MVFPPPLGNGYTLCSKKVFVYRSHSHRFFYSLSATQARPGSTKRTAFLRYINPISLLSVSLQRHLFTLEAVNIPSFHHPLHSDAVLFQLLYHPLNNNSTLPHKSMWYFSLQLPFLNLASPEKPSGECHRSQLILLEPVSISFPSPPFPPKFCLFTFRPLPLAFGDTPSPSLFFVPDSSVYHWRLI